MTRDRLESFRAAGESRQGYAEIIMSVTETISPLSLTNIYSFTDEIFYKSNKLHFKIINLQSCINDVKILHESILTSSTEATDTKLRNELDERMSEIKVTTLKVKTLLNNIQSFVNEQNENLMLSELEHRIGNAQVEFLSHLFATTMTSYTKIQNEHRENCKKRIQRQLEITGKFLFCFYTNSIK